MWAGTTGERVSTPLIGAHNCWGKSLGAARSLVSLPAACERPGCAWGLRVCAGGMQPVKELQLFGRGPYLWSGCRERQEVLLLPPCCRLWPLKRPTAST